MAEAITWRDRWDDAKPYMGPVLAGLVLATLAGWLVWHEVLPRERANRAPGPLPKDEAARVEARRTISAEVEMLEGTYRRAIEAGEGQAALAVMLDRVVARQRERLRLEPEGNTAESGRLARLEAERSSLRSRVASTRSLALEREAQAAGLTAESMGKLREALRLQREANANAVAGEGVDVPRETRLAQAIAQVEAEPLHLGVETALTRSRAALALGEKDAALRALNEARATQVDLNQRYAESRYADVAQLDRIDAEIASLKAVAFAEISAGREREGDAAAAAGKVFEAAAAYAVAAAAQRELNEKFPRSRSVSAARADELEAKRQTMQAVEPLARVAALGGEIEGLLRRRQSAPAVEKISAATALFEKTMAENPRSRAPDAGLQQRLAYLAAHTGELEALQSQVQAQLVPLAGVGGFSMLRTELLQDLYARVMNTNPSRNPGRTLPVDSVSWHDAREFCQRLGWVLGVRVRLPTAEEFRSLFISNPGAWSADTSGGKSHEPGKPVAGFADLAGNLAEWLQPVSDAGDAAPQAPVAGGSYLDTAEALQRLPITLVEKRERARHIGFRVVVESVPEQGRP